MHFAFIDHNQARIEAKNVNGDVRGSYKYFLPDGEEYQVIFCSLQITKFTNQNYNSGQLLV